jgi:hypothetical protein
MLLWRIYFAYKYKKYSGLLAKWTTFLSCFKQVNTFSTDFIKVPNEKFHGNPSKSDSADTSGQTDGWTEGHDEANRRFSRLWEHSKNGTGFNSSLCSITVRARSMRLLSLQLETVKRNHGSPANLSVTCPNRIRGTHDSNQAKLILWFLILDTPNFFCRHITQILSRTYRYGQMYIKQGFRVALLSYYGEVNGS